MKPKESFYQWKKRKLCIMGSLWTILGILVNLFSPNFEVFFCYSLFVFANAAVTIWGLWKLKQMEKEEENSVSDYYPK